MKKKLLLSVLAFSLVLGGFIGVPFGASEVKAELPDSADTMVNRLNEIYNQLTETEKDAISTARADFRALWDNSKAQAEDLTEQVLGPVWTKIEAEMTEQSLSYPDLKADLYALLHSLAITYSPGFEHLDGVRTNSTFVALFDQLAEIAGVSSKPSLSDISSFFTAIEAAVGNTLSSISIFDPNTIINFEDNLKTAIQTVVDARATVTAQIIDNSGITAADLITVKDNIEGLVPASVDARNALAAAYIRLLNAEADNGSSGGVIIPPANGGDISPPNAEEILSKAEAVLEGLADLPAGDKSEALQNAKEAVAEAIKNSAKLDVSEQVTTNDDVATVEIDETQMEEAFNTIQENAKVLNDKLMELAPSSKPARIVATISVGEITAGETNIPLSKDLVDKAKAAGIQAIAVEVNGITLEFDLDDLDEDNILTITTLNEEVATDATDLPVASGVYNFEMNSNSGGNNEFKKPVKVSIPVPSTEGIDEELLVLARINDDGTLSFFGGNYNSEIGSFEGSRDSFSSYTVVENKVSFNDTETVKTWAGRQIDVVAAKGILEGRSEGVFDPNANITRAEFAKLIVKTFGLEDDTVLENFDDVNNADWFRSYVAVAAEAGIVNGRDADTFDPHANISRAEMATMASRALIFALDYNEVSEIDAQIAQFTDASDILSSLKEGVALAATHGIVIGSNGEFNPNGYSTRAEAAVVIYRLINL